MAGLPEISIRLHGDIPARECARRAELAEKAGFHAAWFAENAFTRGILPAATACAIVTSKLNFRVGVFNPTSRHPTMMAMEIGALDELAGGRVGVSVGAGIGTAVSRIGGDPKAPLAGIRDTVTILRALLAGEEVDHDGKVCSAKGVRLEFDTRQTIPIFIAARGEQTLKFCGQSADGLIVSNMCSLDYAARSADVVRDAEEHSKGTRASTVVRYLPGCIDCDGARARAGAKHMLKGMVPSFWRLSQRVESARQALFLGTGLSEQEFSDAAERLQGGEAPETALSDRFVSAFAIAGTPEECVEQARRHKKAGISELAVTFDELTLDDDQIRFGEALRRQP
ncbi:LLM class flavin-dependent oxidoreductase [Mesorhizobium sp. A556]